MSRGYTANALNHYMKQHGATEGEANREFHKMIGDINKIVNQECFLSRPYASRQLRTNVGRSLYTSRSISSDSSLRACL